MIERALGILLRLESMVAAVAYSIVGLLLMVDVLGREFFGASLFGAQKMAVYAAIVAGFLGMALATASAAHLRPAFMDGFIPEGREALVDRIGDAISAVIYLVLAWVAIGFVGETMAAGDRAAVLYWTLWPIQLVIPYAFVSCALRHLAFAWRPALRPETAQAA
jgi:TRAP-type C4-dicarboxylate transport system permease small subunit